MQIVGGKVIGKSPNRIDSLSYHSWFWKGGPAFKEVVDDDDIDTHDQFRPEVRPAYGLACAT